MNHVMQVVIKKENHIRSHALVHSQFVVDPEKIGF